MEDSDRSNRYLARLLAITTLIAGIVYIAWAFRAVNPAYPVMGFLFIVAEICCLALFLIAVLGVWRIRFKPPEGSPIDRPYSIDVLVPVYDEPLQTVRRTLEGAHAIRWSGEVRVFVLDDGASDELQELVRSLGFDYLSRRRAGLPQTDAKAGNLNFGLANCSSELVLVLDADQVPSPNILQALAGYMRFPKLAFIQSKQTFRVPSTDPFFSNDHVFYDAVQLG